MSSAQIDVFLTPLDERERVALQDLRARLLALLPGAEERLSYGMPGLRYGGRMVAGYNANKSTLAFYPHSGGILPGLANRLAAAGFSHTKSALHFAPDHPIPEALLRDILSARLDEAGIAKPGTLA